MPDLKTIANLRKDNAKAIRSVCRQFGLLCPEMALFTHEGGGHRWGKFKAVKKRDKNFTPARLQRRMQQIEESIDRSLKQLDTADRQDPSEAQGKKRERL